MLNPTRLRTQLLVAASICTLASLSSPAMAQGSAEDDPVSAGLDEIVVTATKRETNAQSTPIAVAAIGGEALESRGISDVAQLAASQPSLVFGSEAGFGYNVSIRGIDGAASGIGADTPVAMYVDGVYMGRNSSGVFSLVNVDRIEVLRGPQGTLFGRNATAGALHIITKKPGEGKEVFIEGTYGNFDKMQLRAGVSGNITDTLSASVAGVTSKEDNFLNVNAFDGRAIPALRSQDLRFALRYQPSTETDIVFRADIGSRVNQAGRPGVNQKPGYVGTAANASIANVEATLPYIDDINVDSLVFNERDQKGASLTIEHDFGSFGLTSITAYRESFDTFQVDSDASPAQLQRSYQAYEDQSQWSQELRLVSDDTGPFKWLIGGYFFRENAETLFYADRFNLGDEIGFKPRNRTTSFSAFAEFSYELVDGLTATVGARYTDEKKDFSNVFVRDTNPDRTRSLPRLLPFNEAARVSTTTSWNDFSPKFVLSWQADPNVFIYASAQKGFKSGGNNFTSADFAVNPTFSPETVWSYEGGIKTDLFDRRVRLNLIGFIMKYKDLQIRAPGVSAGTTIFRNASDADIKGLEFESSFLIADGLRLDFNASWLDAKYQNYAFLDAICIGGQINSTTGLCVLSGNTLQRAPKLSTNLGISYTTEVTGLGNLDARVSWSHNSKTYFDDRNTLGHSGFDLIDANLKLTLPDDKWSVNLWARNIGDKRYYSHLNPLGASILGYPNDPRTYGVTVGYSF